MREICISILSIYFDHKAACALAVPTCVVSAQLMSNMPCTAHIVKLPVCGILSIKPLCNRHLYMFLSDGGIDRNELNASP